MDSGSEGVVNIQDILSSSGSLLNPSIMPTIESAKARRNLMIGGVIAAVLVAGGVAYALYRRSKAKKAPSARQSNRRRTSRRAIRRAARKANKASRRSSSRSRSTPRRPPSPGRRSTTSSLTKWMRPGSPSGCVRWIPGRHGPKTFRTIPFGKSGIKAVVAKKKQYKAVT